MAILVGIQVESDAGILFLCCCCIDAHCGTVDAGSYRVGHRELHKSIKNMLDTKLLETDISNCC